MPDRSILEALYFTYAENQGNDSTLVKEFFRQLNDRISCLPFQKSDEIYTIVCRLCTEHERRAYSAGFRDAIRLTQELELSL